VHKHDSHLSSIPVWAGRKPRN